MGEPQSDFKVREGGMLEGVWHYKSPKYFQGLNEAEISDLERCHSACFDLGP